jgi:hypothetical protein
VTVRCDVPAGFRGRGIYPPTAARGFEVVLDVAQPQGGGVIAGRVERRGVRDERPVSVVVRCAAAWMDIAPQLVGQGRNARSLIANMGDVRGRRRPIWIDDVIHEHAVEIGPLDEVNWRPFHIELPPHLPRAFEGTFGALRYQVEARRRRSRALGTSIASLPLLVVERRSEPCVRVERTPIGEWRLKEWRSELEEGFATTNVSVGYEARRLADMPLPGEDREAEILRRTGRVASPG